MLFKKCPSGVTTTATFSNRPNSDSSLSLLIVFAFSTSVISLSQAKNLLLGNKTNNLLVSMSHPRQVFRSSDAPSASYFLGEIKSCLSRWVDPSVLC